MELIPAVFAGVSLGFAADWAYEGKRGLAVMGLICALFDAFIAVAIHLA